MSVLAAVVWIGVGALVGWFLLELRNAPLMAESYAPEPVWGCDCCQDEAEEIAVLEAMWEAS